MCGSWELLARDNPAANHSRPDRFSEQSGAPLGTSTASAGSATLNHEQAEAEESDADSGVTDGQCFRPAITVEKYHGCSDHPGQRADDESRRGCGQTVDNGCCVGCLVHKINATRTPVPYSPLCDRTSCAGTRRRKNTGDL